MYNSRGFSKLEIQKFQKVSRKLFFSFAKHWKTQQSNENKNLPLEFNIYETIEEFCSRS